IAAAATIIHALDVPVIGLNCATGPREMAEHVKWLGDNWPGLISILPNAGLPELIGGQTHYPLTPRELAQWLERFVLEDGVNIIGGCCGTEAEHIAALDQMLRRIGRDRPRPVPKQRQPQWTPSVASLYGQVAFRQENAYLSIGERCNANGSKKWRELQERGDWEGCVAMGREQVKEGSHALDVCTAFVGRDEVKEMNEVVGRMRGSVTAPLVIDSTELVVLESALKLYGGKAILNSINFEDGEAPAAARLKLAKRFGAAVVALTIDEHGMAKDVGRKVEIARRLVDFACDKHGLKPHDLLIDPLTFTIATGNEDDRKLGLWTLEGIERIRAALPEVQIILGLSNISFGLNPPARHVLNSVMLDHALKRGLTGAILHHSKIMPLHKIPEEEAKIAEDLIFDRRRPGSNGNQGYDPLHAFLALFQNRTTAETAKKKRADAVEERLKNRIIDGDKQGLVEDLDLAMKSYKPLDLINTFLLDGMKVVGDLFGSGKMQLPFVLQSAETMKAAVAHLEKFMERVEGQQRGTIVLATVKGDVHDIGKNLVDIILSNNGYEVVNLGIKQPMSAILEAAKEQRADVIGMSGLLVKSTVIMKENLEELNSRGLAGKWPVVLGGAALTRAYVEQDLAELYQGEVRYARDAFEGLRLMDAFMAVKRGEKGAQLPPLRERRVRKGGAQLKVTEPEDMPARSDVAMDNKVPGPPFFGDRVVKGIPMADYTAFLDERATFMGQWGLKPSRGGDGPSYEELVETEGLPRMRMWLERIQAEGLLEAGVVYGYFPAVSEGDDLVVLHEDGSERTRFTFPRQRRDRHLCLADFFRPRESGELDVVGFQLVTVGSKISKVTAELFANNSYRDYLELHGLSVQLAEALAEYWHTRIRSELGFGAEDSDDVEDFFKLGYRGARFSLGYGACPDLEDRAKIVGLLKPDRIGVELSEEFQLAPEQSTDAIVIHHPEAKYFNT
ncbi:MAG: methionine synthase, partial [Streptosporangiaceae bacterium]|nr:methionine synthase [Streptosporangiaceae bacterium]